MVHIVYTPNIGITAVDRTTGPQGMRRNGSPPACKAGGRFHPGEASLHFFTGPERAIIRKTS